MVKCMQNKLPGGCSEVLRITVYNFISYTHFCFYKNIKFIRILRFRITGIYFFFYSHKTYNNNCYTKAKGA